MQSTRDKLREVFDRQLFLHMGAIPCFYCPLITISIAELQSRLLCYCIDNRQCQNQFHDIGLSLFSDSNLFHVSEVHLGLYHLPSN